MDNTYSFHTKELGEVTILYADEKPNGIVLGGNTYSRFDLLALAERATDKKAAAVVLQLASILFHWQDDSTFNSLYGAVAMSIAWATNESEATIYDLFSKNFKNVLGENVEIVKRTNNGKHIPDFWIKTEQGVIPVEVKLKDFNLKALHQLSRYISFYETTGGVAVGENLTVELPENITFVSIESLKGCTL